MCKLDRTLHTLKISKDMMEAHVTFKGQTHSFKSCFITDFFWIFGKSCWSQITCIHLLEVQWCFALHKLWLARP